MKKILKKSISVLLTVVMLISVFAVAPFSVSALMKTYTMNVGETKMIHVDLIDTPNTAVIAGSCAWISNDPFNVEITSQSGGSYCTIKANGATIGSGAILECRYSYWQYNPLTNRRTRVPTAVASCRVKVEDSGPAKPTSVSLSNSSLYFELGTSSSRTLTATVSPSNAATNYTWTTSNSSVATVSGYSSSATVTPTGTGTCRITCTTDNGKSATCYVTVAKPTLNLSSTSPKNNATGVALDSNITFTYDKNIAKGNSFNSISLTDAATGQSVPFTAGISGKVLTLSPKQNFNYQHSYTATVPIGSVTGSDGSALKADSTVKFTTEGNNLTVKATSNLFEALGDPVIANGETIRVAYYFGSIKDVCSAQWKLSYDSSSLKLAESQNYMPQFSNGVIINDKTDDLIIGNCASTELYKVDARRPFIQVTFEVIGRGETIIDLDVTNLTLAQLDEDTGELDEETVEIAVEDSTIKSTNIEKGMLHFFDTPKNTTAESTAPTGSTNSTSHTDSTASYLMGDVNLDGDVDITDVTLIQESVVEKTILSAKQRALADMNGDGIIDIKDATEIQMFIVKH